MTAQSIPLPAGRVTNVYGGYTDARTVINDGAVTVLLYRSPSGGIGVPIRPGSAYQWVYPDLAAAPDSGTTAGSLIVSADVGAISDAGAIAREILTQGLAGQIAAEIAITGAPPIDANDVLYNQIVNIPGGTWAYTPIIDVSKYQSLIVWVVDEGNNLAGRTVNITFGVDVGGTFIAPYDKTSLTAMDQRNGVGYRGSYASYVTPVRGPKVQLSTNVNPVASNVHIIVIGSYKAVARSTYRMINHDALSSGLPAGAQAGGTGLDGLSAFTWLAGITAGTYSWFPNHVNGWAKLAITVEGVGAYFAVVILDAVSNIPLYQGPNATPSTPISGELILPSRPVSVYFILGGAPSFARFAMMTEPTG